MSGRLVVVWVAVPDDSSEPPAVFVNEAQAQKWAELRGGWTAETLVCDRETGQAMIEQAREDDDA
jgi:hypothetical protein